MAETAEAVEALLDETWPTADGVYETAEVELPEMADIKLTQSGDLERELMQLTPLEHSTFLDTSHAHAMDSLHLDSPLLLPDAVVDRAVSPVESSVGVSVGDEMYNHHALLALQDSLQETSRPTSVTSTHSAPATSSSQPFQPSHHDPLTIAPAAVITADQHYSAVHQKRLDAYYLRLHAYHTQRALANEEKQQLDDRRDRILEQHTLTRLKAALRQQHKQLLHTTHHTTQPPPPPTPPPMPDPLEATLARQAEVAALREAWLANKHRMQAMYAGVAALRKENEELAEEKLRRAKVAAEEAAAERQVRVHQLKMERQRRAKRLVQEREASTNFVTIANSVAQQVGQLERKEWREHKAADTKQAVQGRKQRATERHEQVQAVNTENYHRRQINALLQQQAAHALLAQRQQVTQQRQQQHRIALLTNTITQRGDRHALPFPLPPSAIQPPSLPPPAALSVSSSQGDGTVGVSPLSSFTPILPFSNASFNSSIAVSPLLTAQAAKEDGMPTTSPLAPLLFLLESKAKREAEQQTQQRP